MASMVHQNPFPNTHAADVLFCRVLLGSRDWIEALPATLTANGFCDAQKYQYCEPKYMSGFWTDA